MAKLFEIAAGNLCILLITACISTATHAHQAQAEVIISSGENVLARTGILLSNTTDSSWSAAQVTELIADPICPKEQMWTGVKASGFANINSAGIYVRIDEFVSHFTTPNTTSSIPCPAFEMNKIIGLTGQVTKESPLVYVFDSKKQNIRIEIKIN